jgi:hypothetical protein
VTPLVPIARLLAGSQHFACTRLSARLTAACCVARQDAARVVRTKGSHAPEDHGVSCRRCPDGDAVRARLAGGAR